MLKRNTWIGMLLALTGGFLDAYTYLWRGQVLATAITGNLVLMGVHLVDGHFAKSFGYVFSIIAFMGGVFVSNVLLHILDRRNVERQWQKYILLIEILALAIAGFFPLNTWDTAANMVISFVSALQISCFRNFCGYSAFTTMCSGNVKNIVDGWSQWLLERTVAERDKAIFYTALVFSFMLGVFTCNLFSRHCQQFTILLATIPLLITYLLIHTQENT